MRMPLKAKSPWSSKTSFSCLESMPFTPEPSQKATSWVMVLRPENGLPQKTDGNSMFGSVLAGILTMNWRVSWP